MRILVVDDDEDLRSCIREFLRRRDYDVDVAANGLEAVRQLEHIEPDLVISDIQMPLMNGVELLRTIRERFPDVPVILMTGNTTFNTAIEALRCRAYHYLKKPIRMSELQACVERCSQEFKAD